MRLYFCFDKIKTEESKEITLILQKTIKKVREDIEQSKFNTAISTMMIFVNQVEKNGLGQESYMTFLRVIAPFAPHLAEELWREQGRDKSIHTEAYPEVDEELAKDDVVVIGVQINGKLRGTISVTPSASEAVVREAVEKNETLNKYLTEG